MIGKTKKLLEQQLYQLSEKSKDPMPENECDYAYAMTAISKELLKRECFAVVLFIALCYFFKSITIHGK